MDPKYFIETIERLECADSIAILNAYTEFKRINLKEAIEVFDMTIMQYGTDEEVDDLLSSNSSMRAAEVLYKITYEDTDLVHLKRAFESDFEAIDEYFNTCGYMWMTICSDTGFIHAVTFMIRYGCILIIQRFNTEDHIQCATTLDQKSVKKYMRELLKLGSRPNITVGSLFPKLPLIDPYAL